MSKKYVYNFSEGNKEMRSLLGGKGANLAEMKGLGINVPPGFTITTESCNSYYENGERIKPEILKQINEQLEILEKNMQYRQKMSDSTYKKVFIFIFIYKKMFIQTF